MKKIKILIALFLAMGVSLLLTSCAENYVVEIYAYDGEEYHLLESKKVLAYHEYHFSEYESMSLDGYKLLGFIATTKKNIKNMGELETTKKNNESNYFCYSRELGFATWDSLTTRSYYPIFVKEDEVNKFYENSTLAEVIVYVIPVIDGSFQKMVAYQLNFRSTFLDLFQKLDQGIDYEFLGFSKERVNLSEEEGEKTFNKSQVKLDSRVMHDLNYYYYTNNKSIEEMEEIALDRTSNYIIYAYYQNIK